MDSILIDSGEWEYLTVNHGEINRDDYRFISWNTREDRAGAEYMQGQSVTLDGSDLNLYAQWYEFYEIGDIGPGGELVFYSRLDESTPVYSYPEFLYLEVVPKAYEGKLAWGEKNLVNGLLRVQLWTE